MTAQAPDKIFMDGTEYRFLDQPTRTYGLPDYSPEGTVAGVPLKVFLRDPSRAVLFKSSAFWRGHIAALAVENGRLFLRNVLFFGPIEELLPVNGIPPAVLKYPSDIDKPEEDRAVPGDESRRASVSGTDREADRQLPVLSGYRNLWLPCDYTGSVLMGSESAGGRGGSFWPTPSLYLRVIQVDFLEGNLTRVHDLSVAARILREAPAAMELVHAMFRAGDSSATPPLLLDKGIGEEARNYFAREWARLSGTGV